jgi:hypothetical protein
MKSRGIILVIASLLFILFVIGVSVYNKSELKSGRDIRGSLAKEKSEIIAIVDQDHALLNKELSVIDCPKSWENKPDTAIEMAKYHLFMNVIKSNGWTPHSRNKSTNRILIYRDQVVSVENKNNKAQGKNTMYAPFDEELIGR